MPSDSLFSAPGSASPFTGLLGPIVLDFFAVDELSLAFLVCVAILAALLILCTPASTSFFRHLVLLLFFFIGVFGLLTAVNVVTFFGCWELCSLFAWAIGQTAGDAEVANEGVVPFQAAGALGSFAMFFGLALLAIDRRSLLLGPADAAHLGPVAPLLLLGIVLKTYGMLSEEWNHREAHGFNVAGATLAGAGVLSVGLYPFFRLFGQVLAGISSWREPVDWIAGVFTILTALAALGEVDFRRALSYGVFSQFWLLILVGSIGTRLAMLGAVIGAAADALAFTGLFLALSAAEEATAQILLRRVGGLAQRLPLTATLFVVCAVSIVGLPPLSSFVADGLLSMAAASSSWLPLIWMVVGGLTMAYLVRLFAALFLGELRGPVKAERRWPLVLANGGVVGTLVLMATLATSLLTLLESMASSFPG